MKKRLKDFYEKNDLNIDSIINEYNAYLYKILLNDSSFSKEDIEEILSDVYVGFWKKREELDMDMLVQPYLVGILRNVMKNRYRSFKPTVPLNLDIKSKEEDILDFLSMEEKKSHVQKVLKTLNQEEYQIFIMYYYSGYKVSEISKILNFTVSKVKVTLFRVRKKLKKNWE